MLSWPAVQGIKDYWLCEQIFGTDLIKSGKKLYKFLNLIRIVVNIK